MVGTDVDQKTGKGNPTVFFEHRSPAQVTLDPQSLHGESALHVGPLPGSTSPNPPLPRPSYLAHTVIIRGATIRKTLQRKLLLASLIQGGRQSTISGAPCEQFLLPQNKISSTHTILAHSLKTDINTLLTPIPSQNPILLSIPPLPIPSP